MSTNKQALRKKAEKAGGEEWQVRKDSFDGEYAVIVKGSLVKRRGWSTHRPVSDEVADKKTADFIAAANPATVLALLDELEAKDKAWSAQDNHINQQADRIESLEKKNGELGRALRAAYKRDAEQAEIIEKQEKWIKDVETTMIAATDRAEAAEKRIAELEASHSNLREAMAGIHNTITAGGAYTPLAAIMNASKRAYEESAAAAGKGE
ncbi:ead/Ea22-like family protein [Pseudocitrobacter sp. 2023EL-00150]|uniref:ead/Ea22-like family protein n=1 Tax=Pseudocitrobacter sp. 2023EL-00150 TaxID=3032322 RepID=UPI0023E42D4C|nr:ead/Ea22-like family protein [Pseudocitrobacter sp. 2023EL-00150]MDF3830737.1 ead/Ea22-like family protein [Pseudocitrobacter sp. 2023EL-00150]